MSRKLAASLIGVVAATGVLSACSSTSPAVPTATVASSESASSGAAQGDEAMQELGDSIVAAKSPLNEAGRQIAGAGYIWRVTMLDGQPQPATKDYRPDRFDLEVVDGAVVAFTVG